MTEFPSDERALAEAVQDCLEALRRGESIEDCVSRYPDIADELRHLLTASLAVSDAAPTRDESARQMAHIRFEGAVRHHLALRGAESERLSIRQWWIRRAPVWSRIWAVGLASMALLVLLSTGAAYASTDALPDSPLYPVKRATEHARLAITFSDENRAIYHLELIERRSLELAAVVETGDQERAQELNRDLLKHIEFARLESGYTHNLEVSESELAQNAVAPTVMIAQTEAADDGTKSNLATARTLPVHDSRLLAYIRAERATAAKAYATLHIAYQIAPSHMHVHVNDALTITEQRYKQAHFANEPAPLPRTLLAQGVVRIDGAEMTIANVLRFDIAHNALGNRLPQDGDVVTVGGYVRDDGTLLVLRVFSFEADDVADDQIWLQGETLGRNEEFLLIPGFIIRPQDWGQLSEETGTQGQWLYVSGTAGGEGHVHGIEINEIGGNPIPFPLP